MVIQNLRNSLVKLNDLLIKNDMEAKNPEIDFKGKYYDLPEKFIGDAQHDFNRDYFLPWEEQISYHLEKKGFKKLKGITLSSFFIHTLEYKEIDNNTREILIQWKNVLENKLADFTIAEEKMKIYLKTLFNNVKFNESIPDNPINFAMRHNSNFIRYARGYWYCSNPK
jgi:hypothetical protein